MEFDTMNTYNNYKYIYTLLINELSQKIFNIHETIMIFNKMAINVTFCL